MWIFAILTGVQDFFHQQYVRFLEGFLKNTQNPGSGWVFHHEKKPGNTAGHGSHYEILVGGNSNIFYVHPNPFANDPIWLQ